MSVLYPALSIQLPSDHHGCLPGAVVLSAKGTHAVHDRAARCLHGHIKSRVHSSIKDTPCIRNTCLDIFIQAANADNLNHHHVH
jgi:hypothetical protein